MLSISHALTGAFIASRVPNPIISTPIILAAHYFEDWILHWDVGTGLTKGTRKKRDAILLEIGDLIITFILLFLFFQMGKQTLDTTIWYGAFIGLLPDFMEAPKNFLKADPWFAKPFNYFHKKFHHSTPNIALGLLPQAIVVGLIFLLK